jgi:hypothetical protein
MINGVIDMKKFLAILLILSTILTLSACGRRDKWEISIGIPAGSTEEYVFSDTEFCPSRKNIIISSAEGAEDVIIVLKPVETKKDKTYEPVKLTKDNPIKIEAERGGWFKVGVKMQNPTDEYIRVSVNVENVSGVRIE